MIIIGERINGTRKKIGAAIANRDADHIKNEATSQVERGATYLDVNAGTVGEKEVEDMKWLVETVRSVVNVPLCVDSPNPDALRAGLKLAGDNSMINSITGEKERYDTILPLIKEFSANVVCLLMDDTGLLSGVDERVSLAKDIIGKLEAEGVSQGQVYFDPTVKPVSTEPDQGLAGLAVISKITAELPEAHKTCGLSNISFGLPERKILNATYLAMMMAAGMDSAIVDPLNKTLMTAFKAARALLGQDDMCMDYLQAARAGEFA